MRANSLYADGRWIPTRSEREDKFHCTAYWACAAVLMDGPKQLPCCPPHFTAQATLPPAFAYRPPTAGLAGDPIARQ